MGVAMAGVGLDPRRVVKGLNKVVRMLEEGRGVKMIRSGSKTILRIEWLNLYVDSEILYALSGCIALDLLGGNTSFDAIASIETSGAKYGVATALLLNKPYFSLHKVEKLTFEDPISADSYSVTEKSATRLYVDRSVARRFKNVVLVDDIRRSSRTINAAAWLLRSSGSNV
jgi:adenine/guanine phosphoribosyltransferase-like PRPP-binding protein